MRMTSSDRSLRLCAFSVLSARICHAIWRSGTTSAVIAFAPRRRIASSRWRPFGVQNPSVGAVTATMGSRNRAVFVITSASRLWWASERSRWKGVGSIRPIGRIARTSG